MWSLRCGRNQAVQDAYRGLLMTGFLLLHIFFVTVFTKGAMPWYNWTALWFQPGVYSVGLFVVMSGYCLMLPVVQADGHLSGGPRRFLKRRLKRIIPPYYAAATLSLAHVLYFPQQYEAYGIQVNAIQDDLNVGHRRGCASGAGRYVGDGHTVYCAVRHVRSNDGAAQSRVGTTLACT